MSPLQVLLVSGSTRAGSTSTAALLTVAALAPDGVTTDLYDGLAALPAFNPDEEGDRLPMTAAHLRNTIATAAAGAAEVWQALVNRLN